MGYRYPVFISYKTGLFGNWVIKYFYPLFSELLKEELAEDGIKADDPYLDQNITITALYFPKSWKKRSLVHIALSRSGRQDIFIPSGVWAN